MVAWAEHMKGQIAETTFRRYMQSLASCEQHLLGRMVGEIDGAIIRGLSSPIVAAVGSAMQQHGAT